MKKRIFSFLLMALAISLILALTACDSFGDNTPESDKINTEDHEHQWTEWETLQEASCVEYGAKARYCECGEEETEFIPMADHKYGAWIVWSEPTCESDGERYKICTVCDHTEVEVLEATDHNPERLPSKDATCTETGLTEGSKCLSCGETLVAQEEIPKLPHQYDSEVVSPTCTEKGYTIHTCECGDSYKDDYVYALDHKIIIDEAIPESCVASGLTEGSHCERCEKILVKQIVIPAKGHTPGEWVVEVEPTCETQGLKYRECTECTITVDTRLIPENGHTVVSIPAVNATCSTDGLSEGSYCSVCNKVILAQIVIPAKGHNYKTTINNPTCLESGYYIHTCECGEGYDERYTDPLGHNEVIDHATLPTCEKNGLTEGSHCERCGEIFLMQTSIPATGHDYYEVVTDPTCTSQGYTTHICNNCGNSYNNSYVTTSPHSYTPSVIAPTCTREGYTAYICDGCADTYYDNYVNVTGHTYGEWEKASEKTVRYCINGSGCEESQIAIKINATYTGSFAITGESVGNTLIKVIATLSDNTTVDVTDFTLENSLITKEGTNVITVKVAGLSTTVSVPAILDNLPGANHINEFTYTVKNGEATITKYIGLSTQVVIPSHINYVPVRTIYAEAFANSKVIESVTIPGSVRTIGREAFHGCSGLKSVTLSEGLETIGGQAFYGCPITSIVIPDSVTDINTYDPAGYVDTYHGAFESCTLLESVVIGDGVSIIRRDTFRGCSSLKNVTIGESVVEIYPYAFAECVSLVDIDIPDSVVRIADYTFSACSSLTNISLGAGLRTIDTEAFENCTSLSEIYMPDSLQTIGRGAFKNCYGLKTVVLNYGLKTIGGQAFYGSAVEAIVIPDSVTNINTYASVNTYYGAFEGCTQLESVVIGNGVSTITRDTFRSCTALKSVSFGNSVTEISQYAFYDCDSLVDLVIGDSVITIDDSAFESCDMLKNITFGASVTTIDTQAFQDCVSIESLYIPGNVKIIGRGAFYGCISLDDLILEEGITYIYGEAFSGTPITYLEIPDSVISIYTYQSVTAYYGAFENCKQLHTVVIGSGLISLSRDTFRGCTALKNLYIENGLQEIGKYAFAECSSLRSISLPESMVVIDSYAFADCTLLSDIDLGLGTQKINEGAFSGCTALRAIVIPGNVQVIGKEAFAGCVLLHEIIIEKGLLHTVGDYVFDECRTARIYYTGTESDWANIKISTKNDYPLNATPFFYSAHKPASEGNFWFYNDNREPAVWNITEAAHKADIYYTELLEKYGSLYSSLPHLAYLDISGDPLFIVTFSAYSTLEVIINPFEQITKSISKQEFYEIAIYDVLMVAQSGSPSMLSMYANVQKELFELLRCKVYDGATDEILKKMDILDDLNEYLEEDMLDGELGEINDLLGDISTILDFSENVFDAMDKICNYLALRGASENFQTILTDIYNDKSNPLDLRLAALNCVSYLQASFGEMIGMVAAGLYVDNIETALNIVAEEAWSACMKACGLEAVTIAAKGVAFLMDKTLNMDASVAAFYQLTAAVKFESSLRKIVTPQVDYLRLENMGGASKYNDAIFLYECAMLKGHDYVIDFYDACQTDFVDTDEFIFEKEKLDTEFSDLDASIDYRYDLYVKSVS